MSLTSPAFAECGKKDIPRFSIEIGTGVSSLPELLIFEKAAISYRIPAFKNHFSVFASSNFQTLPFFRMGIDQVLLGGQYYFLTKGIVQPFLSLGAAWMPVRQGNFGISTGAGLDLMFIENHGLSLNISTSIPPSFPSLLTINGDLNYKMSF